MSVSFQSESGSKFTVEWIFMHACVPELMHVVTGSILDLDVHPRKHPIIWKWMCRRLLFFNLRKPQTFAPFWTFEFYNSMSEIPMMTTCELQFCSFLWILPKGHYSNYSNVKCACTNVTATKFNVHTSSF